MNRQWMLERFALAAIMVAALAAYTVPVADSDFWWHLASGRYIAEHGNVPAEDPFGVFESGDPVRNQTVLQGQWLGQVLLFQAYRLAGADGVITLRATILLSLLAFAWWRCGRDDAPLLGLLGLALAGFLLTGFTGARPQLFSFLAAGALFVILDRAPRDSLALWWLLPPLFLLWANLHGGFLIGLALLGLWSGVALLESESLRRSQWPTLGVILGMTFLATLVSPSGLTTYEYLLQLEGSQLQQRTGEYLGGLVIYRAGHWPLQIGIWVFYGLAAVATALLLRQRAWRQAAVLFALLAAGALAYRYVAFLIAIGLPYVIRGWSQGDPVRCASRSRMVGFPVAGILALAVAGAHVARMPHGGVSQRWFPLEAAEALKALDAHGRVFNFMAWGGFLIWHVPGLQPFIDGRMLDARRLTPYTHILWATSEGIDWFRRGNFRWVVLPPRNRFSQEPYALHRVLQADPRWHLTKVTPVSLVYRRVSP